KAENLLLEAPSSPDFEIQALACDSRELSALSGGVLYFARKGAGKDGHEFLENLELSPQIKAFVLEKKPSNFRPSVPVLVVRDSTAAMALIAKEFYGDPTARAFAFAVTGTNGKTTTSYLVEELLRAQKKRPGRIGTIEVHFEGFS